MIRRTREWGFVAAVLIICSLVSLGCQFPIDAHTAYWLEVQLVDRDDLAHPLAYALVVGSEVETPQRLETTKGVFDVHQPHTEFWFSAAQPIMATDQHYVSIKTPAVSDFGRGGSWDAIVEAINNSDVARVDSNTTVTPLFVGRPGAVPWSASRDHLSHVSDGQTYTMRSRAGTTFGLTVVQNDDLRLEALLWSHDKAIDGFEEVPSNDFVMEPASDYSAERIYVGYRKPAR